MERLTIDEVIEHCKRHTERMEKHSGKQQLEETPIGNSDRMKQYWEHRQVAEWLKKLKAYEQAEEDGLLIRLPCKVGDTVYIVNRYWIDEGHICGIAESDDVDCFCYKVYCDPDCYDMVALVEFNKTWFLTEAEAEQALAKMKGE